MKENDFLHAFGAASTLAEKTDFTYVTSEVVGALIEAGFFKGRKGIAKKEEYVDALLDDINWKQVSENLDKHLK